MRNNTRRLYAALLISLVALLCFASITIAIANPDSITLHTAKVFENIFATGDMLFVMSYDIEYASEPSEDASTSFLINLMSTDNSTLIKSRALSYYQYNLTSIYFSPTQVVSSNLTWGTEYKVRVSGSPALFPTLTEDINMDTKGLSITDYNADGTLTSKQLLQAHCIDIAESLESDWGITLLVTTSGGEQVLNSTGSVTFLDAIPGLNDALPDLFQLSSTIPTVDSSLSSANYSVASRIDARLGPSIGNAFSGIGNFFGIGQNSAAGLWAIIFILTIASIVFLNTGNNTAALVLATPVVVLMTYVGAIPEAITYIMTIFITVYAMYFFWLRGT